jgi:hypothetical protein
MSFIILIIDCSRSTVAGAVISNNRDSTKPLDNKLGHNNEVFYAKMIGDGGELRINSS